MNSLCHKPDFVTELKNDLEVVCNRMSATVKQENYLFIFQKKKPKIKHVPKFWLKKTKLKGLEQNPDFIFYRNYLEWKSKLESIYEEKAKSVNMKSKSKWSTFGEKSSTFFLNLEKQHAFPNQVRNFLFALKNK